MEGEPEWIIDFPEAFRLRARARIRRPRRSPSPSARSPARLHFAIRPRDDEAPVHVDVAHLKSKRTTNIWREGWYRDSDEL